MLMKKFLAVLCALFILVLWPLLLLGTIAQQRLFTAVAVKQLIRASQLGERLPELLIKSWQAEQTSGITGGQVDDGIVEDNTNPLMAGIDPERTQELLKQALPPQDFYAITDNTVSTVANWWHTTEAIEDLPLVVDLGVVKQNFTPVVVSALDNYLTKLPTCSEEELAQLKTGEDGLPNLMVMTCKPAGLTLDSYRAQGWSDNLFGQIFLFAVPDQIDVGLILQKQSQENPGEFRIYNERLQQLRQQSKLAKKALLLGWLLLALAAISIILLRHRPWFITFGWFGWLLLVMTLQCLAVATVLKFLAPAVLPWISGSVDVAVLEMISDILEIITKALTAPLWWVALATGVASIACLVLRFIGKHYAVKVNAKAA